ncbi:MAG TPA: electron transfer flavoprotein subunit beta [Micrococcales bacterium]|uniref:Electron transfer flavoprotein subunit beta n=1 Tax=Miniimonas arenae TaxID=676201 RepID=A0A5C5BF51_9MICO|nr:MULTISPECIES: electron transfer flavoprotein subunit beta [Miniimonas]TNU76175.1 electron transfer flavoprotein subunit beta [Miniimonas arenae]HCX85727.1 electron transfer flavoprotein subunit beta [Micrococcales bacterium]
MRVVVLVKQVPDIVSDRRLGDDHRLVRTERDAVLNEIDEGALETALRAGDALGATVVAVTMGPPSAAGVVRKALQVGASLGVHVLDDALAGSDAVGTARVLAAAVRLLAQEEGDGDGGVGLVVAGMAALDGLSSVVPALVAAELGWPVASFADSVEITPGDESQGAAVTVSRDTDAGEETLRATLPAVVSVTDTIASLRVPSFQTMLAARKATLRVLTAADLGLEPGERGGVGAAGARAVVTQAAPRPPRPAPEVVTRDGAAALVDFLAARGLLEVGA